ncbi:hypothetical protein BOTCAL_0067g00060 [Botryotinia calthae]|uniref:Uncharacterized protein n=1 Tax=Botryotinia calthae TaxID=38488 RepID=A0A4Y8DBR5_9HELO|nr:hypothetical protein BOTCAL_0067g00060 [Botryotinia calthae]
MSGSPYQTIPKIVYHKPPQVSHPARSPPLTSPSYQQASGSYQDVQPATHQGDPQKPAASYTPTSSRYHKVEPQTYYKAEQTPHPTRQGSGVPNSEVAGAKNKLQTAGSTQELRRMVPGSAGQVQPPEVRRRRQSRRSEESQGRCCSIL